MKLIILIVLAIIIEETTSFGERSLAGTENESVRSSKGLYANPKAVDNRNLFSPRMEYDEWTPLGRGDPLKNDPTYDYVPPVLERVHYWMDPSKRTPDPPVLNSGVLILGSSRTEPTFTMRITTPKYQVIPMKESQADSRLDTMSLLDPFLKLMDVSKFGISLNPSTNYYKPAPNPNRIHPVNYQRPSHHQQYNNQRHQQPQALQRPPYTMLMPPPPPASTPSSIMTFATVITSTEAPKTQDFQATTTALQTTTVGTTTASTTTPNTKPNQDSNITTIYPSTVLANTENLYKPVAIAMPEENETIRSDVENQERENFELKRTKADEALAVEAAMPNKDKKTTGTVENNMEFTIGLNSGKRHQSTMHQQKRPTQEHHVNNGNILKSKDPYKQYSRPLYEMSEPSNINDNNLKQSHQSITALPPKGMKGERFQSSSKWGADNRATTVRPATTTRVANTLTTDPMFKHYKQPSEPIKGPFYLIIQGHSKVKTYGANKNPINGLLTSNEIREEAEERRDRYGELYELESAELKRKRGKSLRWYQSMMNHLRNEGEVERRKKFDRSEVKTPAISELSVFDIEDGVDNVENLEEAFGKSEGGSSKKRYLVNDMMNETLEGPETVAYEEGVHRSRQLLGEEGREPRAAPGSLRTRPPATMITVTNPPTKSSADATKPAADGDNFHIESFIALNDDYSPEDVVSLLLKEEGQGSGFGNFVVSLFSKSLKDEDDRS